MAVALVCRLIWDDCFQLSTIFRRVRHPSTSGLSGRLTRLQQDVDALEHPPAQGFSLPLLVADGDMGGPVIQTFGSLQKVHGVFTPQGPRFSTWA